MKTFILSIVLMATFCGQSFAEDGGKSKKEVKKELNSQILSPELEKLFFSERLGETVVKPMYTSAEQLIFTEQIRQAKK